MIFSETAQLIRDHKDVILQRWEKEIKDALPEARTLSKPIIIDTMPQILENLAESISPNNPRHHGAADSTLPMEHGGERARLTSFNITAVIVEFRCFRKVIMELLAEKSHSMDQNCERAIHMYIDSCIQDSVMAFSLVQSQLREQLIATLSHDMRSPITAATLAADVIKRKTKDEFILKNVRKIKVNHRRIDGLIEDLLNTTVLRAGGKLQIATEEVNLKKLIADIIDHLPFDKEHLLHYEGDEIIGYWDKSHIQRAIENLVSNAFKYGDKDKEVSIKATEQYGRVMIAVHNYGGHIPKEEQEAIFQVFRRAESAKLGKRQGWGLGLPLVRAVAEGHFGSVSVESFKDQGTTFIIDVPKDVRALLATNQK